MDLTTDKGPNLLLDVCNVKIKQRIFNSVGLNIIFNQPLAGIQLSLYLATWEQKKFYLK